MDYRLIGAAFLAVALSACGGNAAPDTANPDAPAVAATDAPLQSTEEPAADPNAPKAIGETVTLDGLSMTVTGATTATEVATTAEYMSPIAPAAGARWVLVTYDVMNSGTDAASLEGGTVIDDQGREFIRTIMTDEYMPEGSEDCSLAVLNPGLGTTCTDVFEVPEGAAGLAIRLSGSFLGETAVVDLGLD